jgi:hypothetical protein
MAGLETAMNKDRKFRRTLMKKATILKNTRRHPPVQQVASGDGEARGATAVAAAAAGDTLNRRFRKVSDGSTPPSPTKRPVSAVSFQDQPVQEEEEDSAKGTATSAF